MRWLDLENRCFSPEGGTIIAQRVSAGNRDFLASESLQGRHRMCRPYGTRLQFYLSLTQD